MSIVLFNLSGFGQRFCVQALSLWVFCSPIKNDGTDVSTQVQGRGKSLGSFNALMLVCVQNSVRQSCGNLFQSMIPCIIPSVLSIQVPRLELALDQGFSCEQSCGGAVVAVAEMLFPESQTADLPLVSCYMLSRRHRPGAGCWNCTPRIDRICR